MKYSYGTCLGSFQGPFWLYQSQNGSLPTTCLQNEVKIENDQKHEKYRFFLALKPQTQIYLKKLIDICPFWQVGIEKMGKNDLFLHFYPDFRVIKYNA